ncbi:MAG TPA: ribonuclease E/G, partial [Bradyrhizobium sp.]|nr:ribonuclease E/G [Bradyrhizobium sp.]
MPNKMLIDATHPEETRVVVVRGNRVEEFDFETAQRKQLRGNIYLAKVTRVEPSLQAAFIEYGGNRHGFLAFSEIHPDYYQIPVADRQALIEADERAHREAEEESENRSNRHRRPRHRNARRRGNGERVQSEVVNAESSEPPQAAQPHDHEHHDHEHGENGHDHAHDAGHHQADADHHGHEGVEQAHEHVHDADHAHDHAHDQPDHGHVVSEASAPESQTEMPVSAAIEASVASPPDAPTEAEVREEAGHDVQTHEEHAFENQAHADDAPRAEHSDGDPAASQHDDPAAAPQGDEHHDDDEDEGEEAEEEIVESVGGDDVLEEVPERAFRPRRQYKIQEVIKRRQVMLVQVVKEERGNKGAALTTYL